MRVDLLFQPASGVRQACLMREAGCIWYHHARVAVRILPSVLEFKLQSNELNLWTTVRVKIYSINSTLIYRVDRIRHNMESTANQKFINFACSNLVRVQNLLRFAPSLSFSEITANLYLTNQKTANWKFQNS